MGNLYTEMRPDDFDEVLGNEAVISKIKDMVETDKIPSVLLFHGPYGSGKTTLARLVPKALGVKKIDIQEFDIGAITGADNIRAIREKSQISPMASKYKFYILDEFHAASSAAHTASLKWLEDTPKHVKVIICTTEVKKLPKTVLSRCVPFKIEPLSPEQIITLVKSSAEKIGEEISDKTCRLIAEMADGSPRQALVYFEAVLGLSLEEAREVLNSVGGDGAELKQLFQIMLKNSSWSEYCSVLKELKEEPETVRRATLGYMSAIMLNQSNGKQTYLNKLAAILEIFENNWYDSGRAGMIKACYEVCCLGGK